MSNGQGALEYLLLIGGAVSLVIIIHILLLSIQTPSVEEHTEDYFGWNTRDCFRDEFDNCAEQPFCEGEWIELKSLGTTKQFLITIEGFMEEDFTKKKITTMRKKNDGEWELWNEQSYEVVCVSSNKKIGGLTDCHGSVVHQINELVEDNNYFFSIVDNEDCEEVDGNYHCSWEEEFTNWKIFSIDDDLIFGDCVEVPCDCHEWGCLLMCFKCLEEFKLVGCQEDECGAIALYSTNFIGALCDANVEDCEVFG